MGTKTAGRGYRAIYGVLLRLYPRAFRERFRAEMAQTFGDLCREREDAKRGLFGMALWVFCETSMEIVKENVMRMSAMGKTVLRVALVALGLLMVPLVASRVVEGWNWPVGAFVFVYFLFFATGMAYALIARKMRSRAYKAGVGMALAGGFALGWSNMVHVADSHTPEDMLYFSVIAVGVAGAWVAQLEARGLARTLFAMAATLALLSAFLPSWTPFSLMRNLLVPHAVLVALFVAAGMLFRKAGMEAAAA